MEQKFIIKLPLFYRAKGQLFIGSGFYVSSVEYSNFKRTYEPTEFTYTKAMVLQIAMKVFHGVEVDIMEVKTDKFLQKILQNK